MKPSNLIQLFFLIYLSIVQPFSIFSQDRENPYNKFRNRDRESGAMSLDQELKFAEAAHQEISKKSKFVTDSKIVDYVNTVGKRVATRSLRPDLPYKFYVINDDSINAFTPGGGRIYIYTGLLKRMTTEGQLASVLAHEIGHNVGYHISQQVKKANEVGFAVGILGAILGNGKAGQIGVAASSLLANGYLFKRSRDAEREADYLGLYEINDAGYNTDEMNSAFRMLEAAGKQPGTIDKVFASHPPASERLENTQREIAEHLSGTNQRGTRSTSGFDTMKHYLVNPVSSNNSPKKSEKSEKDSEDRPRTTRNTPTKDRQDAERLLQRRGKTSSQLIEALRADVTGNGILDGLIVIYEDEGDILGFVDVSGKQYDLLDESDYPLLPISKFIKLKMRENTQTKHPQIVIVGTDRKSNRRRDFWEWSGRSFEYIGNDFKP